MGNFPNYPSGEVGLGVQLLRGNAGCPESFTAVGRVGDFNGPDSSRAAHKTSAHNTDPSAAHTYIPGMLEPGKVTFPLFIKTDTAADRQLATDFANGTMIDWMIQYDTDTLNSHIDFTGFIDSFKLAHPVDGVVKCDISIKLSGKIYYFEN